MEVKVSLIGEERAWDEEEEGVVAVGGHGV